MNLSKSLYTNSDEAMQAYATMTKMSNEDKSRYKESLLTYCELDTLAMVKVLEKLKESVK